MKEPAGLTNSDVDPANSLQTAPPRAYAAPAPVTNSALWRLHDVAELLERDQPIVVPLVGDVDWSHDCLLGIEISGSQEFPNNVTHFVPPGTFPLWAGAEERCESRRNCRARRTFPRKLRRPLSDPSSQARLIPFAEFRDFRAGAAKLWVVYAAALALNDAAVRVLGTP